MTREIKVPEVSEGVESGTVVSVAVSVGDHVEEDQTLLELETDKAVIAIPSPTAGKISSINVAEGDDVAIGAVIMTLEISEKTEPGSSSEAPEEASGPSQDVPETTKHRTDLTDTEQGLSSPEITEESLTEENVQQTSEVDLKTVRRDDLVAPAAPSVRRRARELGVDIYQVQGTGPGGRISASDVRNYVHDTMQRITGGGPAPTVHGEFPGLHAQRPLPDFKKWGAITREPISRVRELTADSMSYAWSTIPMVTQYDQAKISEMESFRNKFNQSVNKDTKLTMTAILVKVCAAALKVFPHLNSSLDLAQRELILKQYVHIGVAVDTTSGLLVPVIRDAAQKGIEKLASELNALAEDARQRKLKPADMEGGTFTISNLGGIGGTAFTPIVYAPQVAILGVSSAMMQPVWSDNEFKPQLTLPLSLTYDHRVIDGATGARFLRWICEALEFPLHIVMKG